MNIDSNGLQRDRRFSSRCHQGINDGSERTVSIANFISFMKELHRQVDAMRQQGAHDCTHMLARRLLYDLWRPVEGTGGSSTSLQHPHRCRPRSTFTCQHWNILLALEYRVPRRAARGSNMCVCVSRGRYLSDYTSATVPY